MSLRVMLIGSDTLGTAALQGIETLDEIRVVAVAAPAGAPRDDLAAMGMARGLPVYPLSALHGPGAAAIVAEQVLDLLVIDDLSFVIEQDVLTVPELGTLVGVRGQTVDGHSTAFVEVAHTRTDGATAIAWRRQLLPCPTSELHDRCDHALAELLPFAVAAVRDGAIDHRRYAAARPQPRRIGRPHAPGRHQTAKR